MIRSKKINYSNLFKIKMKSKVSYDLRNQNDWINIVSYKIINELGIKIYIIFTLLTLCSQGKKEPNALLINNSYILAIEFGNEPHKVKE